MRKFLSPLAAAVAAMMLVLIPTFYLLYYRLTSSEPMPEDLKPALIEEAEVV